MELLQANWRRFFLTCIAVLKRRTVVTTSSLLLNYEDFIARTSISTKKG